MACHAPKINPKATNLSIVILLLPSLLLFANCTNLKPQNTPTDIQISASTTLPGASGSETGTAGENQNNNGAPPSSSSTAGSSNGKGSLGITPGSDPVAKLATTDERSKFGIYVPKTYDEGSPMGLVILFHDVTSPGNFLVNTINFNNNDRFILVSPFGDPADGAYGAFCQPFAREAMLAVRAAFNIDNRKQYSVGRSGGVYPLLPFALASGPNKYTNQCGQITQSGFQEEFAAVGISSPPTSFDTNPYYDSMSAKTIAQLGFKPAFWADFGANSSDGAAATDLVNWAKNKGYSPATLFSRPGEGHAPEPPFSSITQMFDLFEKTIK